MDALGELNETIQINERRRSDKNLNFKRIKRLTGDKSISIRTNNLDKRSKQCRLRDHEIFLSRIIDNNSDLSSLNESTVDFDSFSRLARWT